MKPNQFSSPPHVHQEEEILRPLVMIQVADY